jgi:hypothetical protein
MGSHQESNDVFSLNIILGLRTFHFDSTPIPPCSQLSVLGCETERRRCPGIALLKERKTRNSVLRLTTGVRTSQVKILKRNGDDSSPSTTMIPWTINTARRHTTIRHLVLSHRCALRYVTSASTKSIPPKPLPTVDPNQDSPRSSPPKSTPESRHQSWLTRKVLASPVALKFSWVLLVFLVMAVQSRLADAALRTNRSVLTAVRRMKTAFWQNGQCF